MVRIVHHLIDGKETPSLSGQTFQSLNPATGEVIAKVAEGSAEDVNLAVCSGHRTFEKGLWKNMTPGERSKRLRRVADMIRLRAEELAQLDTLDCGKPIQDNRKGDLPASAAFFDYFAGVTQNIRSSVIAGDPGYHQYTLREPYGVVACITPWNFPFAQACLKVAPALAAGNSVVVKMAEQTPLSTSELGKICLESGVPEGTVNIIHGFGEVAGAALVRHPLVRKISFTGSSATGREILRAAAEGVKPTNLELGGKTPNIVFSDADLEQALAGTLFTSFFNMGQICTTGSRLLLDERIAQDFVRKLVAAASKLKIGDPMLDETQLGCLVSQEQCDRVLRYIELGVQEGANLVVGGQRPNLLGKLQCGHFVQPTVFQNVNMSMRIAREEIFGPVLSILTFRNEKEAIQIANDGSFGLAAAVWTNDLARAFRMTDAIDAGVIWTNTIHHGSPAVPLSGHKDSGLGEDLGLEAIHNYTQLKTVFMNYGGSKVSWT